MTATIVVTPERLRRAAVAARALGGRLLEVRGHLGATVTGLDATLGDGGARAAFSTLWTRWSSSTERLAAAVDDLAAALEAAADGYEQADRDGTRPSGAAGGSVGGAGTGAGRGGNGAAGASSVAGGSSTGGHAGRGGTDAAAW